MKPIDIADKKFGRLTVLTRADSDSHGQAQWLCKCECGNMKIIKGVALRRGTSKSCGCLKSETKPNYRHGHSTNGITPTYHSWRNMKHRCTGFNIST